ncbi:MAG TPA: PepSY domain-containing protein [Methanobacterium sp.]|nr:PepSY domain-containing protein [Methanobacterium sp.]
MGILFFIGYGVALNVDHIPLNLIQNMFKNNQNNNNGSLNNLQTNNEKINPQKTAKKESTNVKNSVKSNKIKNKTISTSKARSIANKYIDEKGVSSGSPKIVNIGGKDTYVVPIESDGENVGEIQIDPETGENVGGAGGTP